MDGRDVTKLLGIISGFLFLFYVFLITNGTQCFSPPQLFVTYLLITYTIIFEIYDLLVPRKTLKLINKYNYD